MAASFQFLRWLILFGVYGATLFTAVVFWDYVAGTIGRKIADYCEITTWGIWLYFFSKHVLNPMREFVDGRIKTRISS